MKISLSQTEVHDKSDFVAKFYVKKSDGKDFNALLVDCIKGHYKTRLKSASRLYFVIEGRGTFTIDDKKENAELYDFFLVENDQVYSYEGKMKLIEVNVPATNQENEEIVN